MYRCACIQYSDYLIILVSDTQIVAFLYCLIFWPGELLFEKMRYDNLHNSQIATWAHIIPTELAFCNESLVHCAGNEVYWIQRTCYFDCWQHLSKWVYAPINVKPQGGEAGCRRGIWRNKSARGRDFWSFVESRGSGLLTLTVSGLSSTDAILDFRRTETW